MPKKQTDNTLFNRKKSKTCYDKHDPYARNKDRRGGHVMSHLVAMTNAYGGEWNDLFKSKRAKQRRSQHKVNHRKGL